MADSREQSTEHVESAGLTKPKPERAYVFVRVSEEGIESTVFRRHDDGSSGFELGGGFHIFEGSPDSWQEALAALAKAGFVELREARQRGLVPEDWSPKDEGVDP